MLFLLYLYDLISAGYCSLESCENKWLNRQFNQNTLHIYVHTRITLHNPLYTYYFIQHFSLVIYKQNHDVAISVTNQKRSYKMYPYSSFQMYHNSYSILNWLTYLHIHVSNQSRHSIEIHVGVSDGWIKTRLPYNPS